MDTKTFNQMVRVLRELYPNIKSQARGVPVSMARCAEAVKDGLMSIDEGRAFRDAVYATAAQE